MRLLRFWLSAVALLCILSACNDKKEPDEQSGSVREDAGHDDQSDENTGPLTFVDGGPSDPGVSALTCEGVDDGTSCGSMGGLICLDGECVTSTCGDGFTDPRTEETCDDGNDVAADGCEPDCKFMCSHVGDCDDGNACNGNEICDTAAHLCVGGMTAQDETPCMSAAVADGECRSGTCVPEGCGDETVEGVEECDDGNPVSGDGCEPTCTFTCQEDVDCNDNDVCNGEEKCDAESHACVLGTALECESDDECSVGGCDSELGCQLVLIDADGDRYPPDTLSCGSDCDDTRADVNPGQAELCDDVDQDCDGEPQPSQAPTWYLDCDADGYAKLGAQTVKQCEEPAPAACGGRWTTRVPSNSQDPPTADCDDDEPQAHPGQDTWFERPASSGFDYNCDGDEERRWKLGKADSSAACLGTFTCSGPSGWIGGVPQCGAHAAFTECQTTSGEIFAAAIGPIIDPPEPCGIRACACGRVTVERTQQCR